MLSQYDNKPETFRSSENDITTEELAGLEGLNVQGSWLVTHRPPWVSADPQTPNDEAIDDDDTTGEYTKVGGFHDRIGLILTGHQHIFRATSFADHRPTQIIAGNGGTLLQGHPKEYLKGTLVDKDTTSVEEVVTYLDFGFMMLEEKAPNHWAATIYDQNAAPTQTCSLQGMNGNNILSLMSCK